MDSEELTISLLLEQNISALFTCGLIICQKEKGIFFHVLFDVYSFIIQGCEWKSKVDVL